MITCGQCTKEYKTEAGYLNHTCEVTGVKPTEGRAMGPNFERIQAKALERGVKTKAEREKEK